MGQHHSLVNPRVFSSYGLGLPYPPDLQEIMSAVESFILALEELKVAFAVRSAPAVIPTLHFFSAVLFIWAIHPIAIDPTTVQRNRY